MKIPARFAPLVFGGVLSAIMGSGLLILIWALFGKLTGGQRQAER